ncbi:MAG: hypothetical protein U1F98_08590 [Verrucomicrobiota bacterium]
MALYRNIFGLRSRWWFCLVLWVTGLAAGRGQDWLHAGFLYDSNSLVWKPGERTEALGPFFYSEKSGEESSWAIPPFWLSWHDSLAKAQESDILYPLFTYRRYEDEYRYQFFQIFALAGGASPSTNNSSHDGRLTLFPVYFQQWSDDPGRRYWAVFPFYGHLQFRFFRDESFFVMFPLYAQSKKKDAVTDNFLFPIVHFRRGPELRGWQVWPLIGHEHKDPSVSTNGFGDLTAMPGRDIWFGLWPMINFAETQLGTESPQYEQAILPFYDYVRSPDRDSTTVLWPLIAHVTDRRLQYKEWQVPWPLIIFAHGPGKHTTRVFPFYSHAENATEESGFVAWPLYKINHVHSGNLDRRRWRIMLFLYSDTTQTNTETGKFDRRRDFWPFYRYIQDMNGNSRLQIFTPLEPFVPYAEHIERVWSPLWSVWRSESNPKTGASSQSFLWNLYRRDANPESKKCSLLFGLFQYQSGSAGKQLRLFYIPVMKKAAPAAADSGETISPAPH